MKKRKLIKLKKRKRKLISIPSMVTKERWDKVPWYHKMFCSLNLHKWEYDINDYPEKYKILKTCATFRQCKHCGHDEHLFCGEWRA